MRALLLLTTRRLPPPSSSLSRLLSSTTPTNPLSAAAATPRNPSSSPNPAATAAAATNFKLRDLYEYQVETAGNITPEDLVKYGVTAVPSQQQPNLWTIIGTRTEVLRGLRAIAAAPNSKASSPPTELDFTKITLENVKGKPTKLWLEKALGQLVDMFAQGKQPNSVEVFLEGTWSKEALQRFNDKLVPGEGGQAMRAEFMPLIKVSLDESKLQKTSSFVRTQVRFPQNMTEADAAKAKEHGLTLFPTFGQVVWATGPEVQVREFLSKLKSTTDTEGLNLAFPIKKSDLPKLRKIADSVSEKTGVILRYSSVEDSHGVTLKGTKEAIEKARELIAKADVSIPEWVDFLQLAPFHVVPPTPTLDRIKEVHKLDSISLIQHKMFSGGVLSLSQRVVLAGPKANIQRAKTALADMMNYGGPKMILTREQSLAESHLAEPLTQIAERHKVKLSRASLSPQKTLLSFEGLSENVAQCKKEVSDALANITKDFTVVEIKLTKSEISTLGDGFVNSLQSEFNVKAALSQVDGFVLMVTGSKDKVAQAQARIQQGLQTMYAPKPSAVAAPATRPDPPTAETTTTSGSTATPNRFTEEVIRVPQDRLPRVIAQRRRLETQYQVRLDWEERGAEATADVFLKGNSSEAVGKAKAMIEQVLASKREIMSLPALLLPALMAKSGGDKFERFVEETGAKLNLQRLRDGTLPRRPEQLELVLEGPDDAVDKLSALLSSTIKDIAFKPEVDVLVPFHVAAVLQQEEFRTKLADMEATVGGGKPVVRLGNWLISQDPRPHTRFRVENAELKAEFRKMIQEIVASRTVAVPDDYKDDMQDVLQEIKSETGATMMAMPNGFFVTGGAAAMEAAKAKLKEKLQGFITEREGAKMVRDSFEIPRQSVGNVMGVKGSTISRLQFETGVSIKVAKRGPDEPDTDAPVRVDFSGSRAAVDKAKALILAKVEEAAAQTVSGGFAEGFEPVELPEGLSMGVVLGKMGRNREKLEKQCNVSIKVKSIDGVSKCAVKGAPEDVEAFKKALVELQAKTAAGDRRSGGSRFASVGPDGKMRPATKKRKKKGGARGKRTKGHGAGAPESDFVKNEEPGDKFPFSDLTIEQVHALHMSDKATWTPDKIAKHYELDLDSVKGALILQSLAVPKSDSSPEAPSSASPTYVRRAIPNETYPEVFRSDSLVLEDDELQMKSNSTTTRGVAAEHPKLETMFVEEYKVKVFA